MTKKINKRRTILEEHNQVTKVLCIIAPIEFCSSYRYYQFKRVYFYDRCTNPVYFNTPLLIIYLNTTEALICHTKIEFNRVYFLRLCTKYDT